MGTPKTHRKTTDDAAQRNRRMARTLGCLVASMTIGAALLDWVQPKRLPAATVQTELMSIIHQGAGSGNWSSIQLDPQQPVGKTPPSHFVISRDGRAFSTPLWQNHESVGNAGVVRIGLLASDNSNEVTRAQWTRARELVQLLQRECSISGEQIHYDMLAVPSAPTPPRKSTATPPRPSRSGR